MVVNRNILRRISMRNDINNLGKNILKYRKLKGMTQEKLAEFSDLSVTFLSKLERSENQNISIKSLAKIAQTLDVEITDLLATNSRDEEPVESPNVDILVKQLARLDHQKAERLAKYFSLLVDEMNNKK